MRHSQGKSTEDSEEVYIYMIHINIYIYISKSHVP